MKKIKSLNFKTTLILGYIIIIVFLLSLGALSISNSQKLNNEISGLYNQNLLSISELKELKENLVSIRGEMLIVLYDPANRQVSMDKISQLKAQNDEIIARYEKLPMGAGESEIYNQFLPLLKDYRVAREELIALEQSGKHTEALAKFKDVSTIRENMAASLDELINYNLTAAEDRFKTSNEMYDALFKTNTLLIIISILVSLIISFVLSKRLSQGIKSVLTISENLSNKDLSSVISSSKDDEFGLIINSMNSTISNLKKIITEINLSATDVSSSSQELSATTQELTSTMEAVQNSTEEVAQGAEDLSASTEEINASLEEISANSSSMSSFAQDGKEMANTIKYRAVQTKENAKQSIDRSNQIYKENYKNVKIAIDESKIVDQISEMTGVISNLAAQTNLLALNAAIESARAGEAGRGFAVVADEVRKLAEESTDTANKIQQIVQHVKVAVNNLSLYSFEMLKFMEDTVAPDYDNLLKLGIQYESDATYVGDFAEKLASLSEQISESLKQITNAVESNSNTAQDSSQNSQTILKNISEITGAIDEMSKASFSQSEVAEKLVHIINEFKLD